MKNIFVLVIQILLIEISLQAQVNTKVTLDFEKKVPSWMAENNVPAVGIGIIEGGKIKYVKVFGELKKGIPAPDNTIFNIASITKPVITVLTLKIVEAGQWDLDKPLSDYWIDPDVIDNPYHKILTTRHILNHQSGFLNWRRQHPSHKLTFEFKPGTNYQYSGEGFVYLGRALEKRFNKSLVELSDSILFKPLGMKDSRLYWDKHMDESRFAYWHDSKGNILETSTPKDRGVNAAGSMLTTIEDFCKFGIDVINGASLSSDIYDDMINPHVKINEHYARGLGWEIIKDLPNGEYALEHGGSDQGVKTITMLLPKSKRGIVVLTNSDNGMLVYNQIIKESLDVGESIIKYMSGSVIRWEIDLPDKVLKRYVGTYLDSYGRNLTIFMEDSTLIISGKGVPTVKLCPEKENKFFLKDFDVQFEFADKDSFTVISGGKVDCTAKRVK